MIEYSSACFSKGKPDWGTPPKLWDYLQRGWGPFKLDAATTKDNPLKTPLFYTKEDDGLSKKWEHPTYVNPPYGKDVIKWVKKAFESMQSIKTVMLLPARTDTKWFHDYIFEQDYVDVRFLRGRQKMVDLDNPYKKPNTAPFPSMIVIFNIHKTYS
jgi:phage N-6-adenine-methyltransferase